MSTLTKTVRHPFSQKCLVLLVGIIFLASCQKERELAILDKNASIEVKTPEDIVLLKTNADKTLSFTWNKPKTGVDIAINYNLFLDKNENFKKPVFTTKELSKEITIEKLNEVLIDKEYVPGNATDVAVRVEAILSPARSIFSKVASFKATPYQIKVDITTSWGLVGSATPNGWNGPDVPFYKGENSSEFVCYATLKIGDIKFRKDNDWAVNYGEDTAGKIKAGGGNINIAKNGTYKIIFNTAKLTYSVSEFSWGIVGSATPNGWNGPDILCYKTSTPGEWTSHPTLKVGDIKFRRNNDWAVNYGKDTAGKIKAGGGNIEVTEAGDYKAVFNTEKLTYTLEKYSWGIVGDFSGWKTPDTKLKYDYITNTYQAKGVVLKKGGLKFRLNEDWTVNFGMDKAGAAGSLKAGGDNIDVEDGTYDVTLDLSDSTKPKYTLTKK